MITEDVRKAALLEQENFLQNMVQQELDLHATFNRPSFCKTRNFRAASRALLKKRMRTVARTFPRMRESLGEEFETLFRKFAKEQEPSPNESPPIDGLQFAKWLISKKQTFTEVAVLEIRSMDLHDRLHRSSWLGKLCIKVSLLLESILWRIGTQSSNRYL